jgi:hypothetical protein
MHSLDTSIGVFHGRRGSEQESSLFVTGLAAAKMPGSSFRIVEKEVTYTRPLSRHRVSCARRYANQDFWISEERIGTFRLAIFEAGVSLFPIIHGNDSAWDFKFWIS